MTLPNIPLPDELAQVRAELKRLEAREAEIKQALLSDPTTRTGANWLVEVRTAQQSRTDIKELKANHPDIAAQYTFPVEVVRVELAAITDEGEIISARKLGVKSS